MAIKSRTRFQLLLALLTTAMLTVPLAAPASAHQVTAYVVYHEILRGHAAVSSNHLSLTVCDDYPDGVGVYGRMQLRSGTIIDIVDGNGSKSGCGQGTTSSSNPIVRIEAVWRGGASSGWKTA